MDDGDDHTNKQRNSFIWIRYISHIVLGSVLYATICKHLGTCSSYITCVYATTNLLYNGSVFNFSWAIYKGPYVNSENHYWCKIWYQ